MINHALDLFAKVYQFLIEDSVIKKDDFTEVNEMASDNELKVVHTDRYLNSLNWSSVLARILEVPMVAFLPAFVIRSRVLNPMRYATKGI